MNLCPVPLSPLNHSQTWPLGSPRGKPNIPMVNRATEKDGKVMETPTPTPGLCHGHGPASPPRCPHLSELPEEGQGGDQAVFWRRQRKGGLCLPWSTQGVMDDATLVPSSATLPLRNRGDGHSGNSALLLHTPLDPLSFLNFLLLFILPFLSFLTFPLLFILPLFLWWYREEGFDSEKEQCRQIHQLQRGAAEPASS